MLSENKPRLKTNRSSTLMRLVKYKPILWRHSWIAMRSFYATIPSRPVTLREMQANQAALQGFVDQASDLRAPKKYRNQKDAFVSAIDELHQAAQLAYALAADPVSATQADFDDYDRLVDEATAGLRQSNQLLGKDFEGIEGVREVSAS